MTRGLAVLLACALFACGGTNGPGGIKTRANIRGLAAVETCESILETEALDGTITRDKRGCTSHQSEAAGGSEGMWSAALQALSLGFSIYSLAR